MQFNGVWLPIITPFQKEEIDYVSYKRMIEHYSSTGITGIIPLGTTGEVPTLEDYEFEELISKTMEYNTTNLPVIVGIGGNYTKKIIKKLKLAEKYNITGILSVCPYYNKPSQEGIYQHFNNIANETDLDIIVYNIPYRTGTNIENETIHRLASIKNITGIKDSSGDIKQTMALLMDPPKDFSILTGEDLLFYTTLLHGGHGGILASAHVHTEKFVKVYNDIKNNHIASAFNTWKELYHIIPLLFKEPNPSPIKYILSEIGLIDSGELRLPLTTISEPLQNQLQETVINILQSK